MDKEVLRRLGWSEDLIEAAAASTLPSYPPIEGATSSLEVSEIGAGSSVLDLSGAPIIGTTVLVPQKPHKAK